VKNHVKKPRNPMKNSTKKLTKSQKRHDLSSQLSATNSDIVETRFELVRKYIALARAENDAAHLDDALGVLSDMNKSHSMESALRVHVELQSQVAETFLRIGRSKSNRLTLEKAKHAYRAAITLASITGDDPVRENLRQNYRITLSLLGDKPQSPSLFKVA